MSRVYDLSAGVDVRYALIGEMDAENQKLQAEMRVMKKEKV